MLDALLKHYELVVSLFQAKSLENMEGIVNRTLKEGAELLTGEERIKNNGYLFSPTIFKRCVTPYGNSSGRRIGPVAPIITSRR